MVGIRLGVFAAFRTVPNAMFARSPPRRGLNANV